MQDRVPLYPGRVKLTPVAGQENTYDMVRADQPSQEGTPLNKDSLLKDTTAELFGLGADAVPDDVLQRISSLLSNGESVLFLNITDVSGNPCPYVSIGIDSDPNIDSCTVTDLNGLAAFRIGVGSHTIHLVYPVGYSKTSSTKQVEIAGYGRAYPISISEVSETTGPWQLEASQKVRFRYNIGECDIFVCAGGGSGAAVTIGTTNSSIAGATGGAGGKTSTKKNMDLSSGEVAEIIVGTGGDRVISNTSTKTAHGNKGGNSSFSFGGVIVSADGGEGGTGSSGTYYDFSDTRSLNGAPGGSGSGGILLTRRSPYVYVGNSGSDGGDGSSASSSSGSASGGSGQGSTTRIFEESSGARCSGAGYSVAKFYNNSLEKGAAGTTDSPYYGRGGNANLSTSSVFSSAGENGVVIVRRAT